ncbi:MAG: SLBB domain-containing protein [Bacteroidaceae bacterium]|nr:SLBB domain-containing protein [Bacteroidaceae bacterium]
MKKRLTILLFTLFAMCCTTHVMAQSAMSDEQVMAYVQQATAAGKNQKVIAQELALKGVNRQQLERIKKKYEQGKGDAANTNKNNTVSRQRNSSSNQLSTDNKQQVGENKTLYNGKRPSAYLPYSPNADLKARRDKFRDGMLTKEDSLAIIDEYFMEQDGVFDRYDLPDSLKVYGHDLFQNDNLDFAPSENIATPRNYQLGPGDEVIIDIFGANQVTLQDEISPEGSINVDVLGPIYIAGMTVEEANTYLRKRLAGIYAGLGRDESSSDIRLSLGQLRSIQINVLGDVENPGTYTLSSFSTVFHALYQAGGIKDAGTLRNIKVSRGGKVIATVDVYDFLVNGNTRSDIRLQEGDVILVPAYSNMVRVKGLVKRPMYFEMKQGENMQNLLDYAGGFAKSAYTNSVTVIRQTGKDYEVRTVENVNFAEFAMQDGDEVEVGELVSRFQNRLTIKGAVYHEGQFQLSGKVNSIRTLIQAAGGLLPEAFTQRAVLHREKTDRTLEVRSIDVGAIMNGNIPDVVLKNNDQLYIPNQYDMSDLGVLTINGEVAAPGVFPYADHMTLEDLILQAGGLLESASLARVDVNRRVKDNESAVSQNTIAETFSFSLKDGFVIKGEPGFTLQPYDEVFVRKSPSYTEQRNVTVSGEVNFEGTYVLTTRDERLSDLVKRVGGFTDQAYIKGARLIRQMNDDEREVMKKVVDSMIDVNTDSATVARMLNFSDEYFVGIELEKAIANPGSSNDIILREGDRLEVPVYNNTVRVMGEVLSPNVVTYREKKNYKYYVNESGGYTDMSRKNHAYVVHMNGHISRLKSSTEITPGSEIIVPKRLKPKATFPEVMSSVTGMASLATTLVSLGYILKK